MTTKREALDLILRMRDKIGEDSLSDEGFYDLYHEANALLLRSENDPPGEEEGNRKRTECWRPTGKRKRTEAELTAFERDRMPSKKRTPTRFSKTPGKSRWTCVLCCLNYPEEEMQLVRGTGELDMEEPDWACGVCLSDTEERYRIFCGYCWNVYEPGAGRRFHLLSTPCPHAKRKIP